MNYDDFIVSIKMAAVYSKENILQILKNSGSINMTFYQENKHGHKSIISNKDTIAEILLTNDPHCILSKIDDTFITLFLFKDETLKLMISPAPFCHELFTLKGMNSKHDCLDVARYLSTALALCKDFEISKVLAEYIS